MAIFKYITNDYPTEQDQICLFHYVMDEYKTYQGIYIGGNYLSVYERDAEGILQQFQSIRNIFQENRYRKLYHFVLAFDEYFCPGYNNEPSAESYVTMEQASNFAQVLCAYLEIFRDRQVLWAVHLKLSESGSHEVHIHFVVNAVSLRGERLSINDSVLVQTTSQIYVLGKTNFKWETVAWMCSNLNEN